MRSPGRRLAFVFASLLLACAHQRLPADAGGDRTTQSGVPVHFGGLGPLPEGVTARWNFGDGTPEVAAAQADHAFPRAGAFTVTETVLQKGGSDPVVATAKVTVLRRPVPAAVPPSARAALVTERPWARVALQRSVAARLGLRDFYDQVAASVSSAIGFDVTSAEQATLNGFDPDEGLAIFTVREDPEALMVAVGVADEAKAEAALRRLLERDGSAQSAQLRPFQLAEGKLKGGARAVVGTRSNGAEQVAFTFKFGYLYLRTPAATDPLSSLAAIDALQADQGLDRDATFLATEQHVGAGDFVFYSAPPPLKQEAAMATAPAESEGPLARTRAQLGASAFALNVKPDQLEVRLFAELRNLTGEKLVQAFTPLKDPPDLAALLPAGAVAYFKLSGSPAALWRELGRAAGERQAELQERLRVLVGLDVEREWLPSFTGNAGLGFYLDAGALLEAVLGEQVATFDRSTLLAAVEIKAGQGEVVRAALERAMKELGGKIAVSQHEVAGTKVYLLGEGGIVAAQKGDQLYISLGGPRTEEFARSFGPLGQALAPSGQGTLSQGLQQAGVKGFDQPTAQLAYLDVRAALQKVQAAAQQQGGAVGLAAGMMGDKIAGLRDALILARPTADGIDANLTVRFAAEPSSGAQGGK